MAPRIKKKVIPRETDIGTVMFTSLMLILLSFFIMMNTMAVPSEERVRVALGSLLSEFGDESQFDTGLGSLMTMDLGDKPNVRVEEIRSYFENKFTQIGIDGSLQVFLRDQDLVLMLPAFLLASDDPTAVPKHSMPILTEVIRLLEKTDKTIRVDGHSAGDHASDHYSADRRLWKESMQRAQTIVNYLLANSRIPQEQLEVAAYGATRPAASLENPELNMRVEIVVVDGANDERIRYHPYKVRIGGRTFWKHTERDGATHYEKQSFWSDSEAD